MKTNALLLGCLAALVLLSAGPGAAARGAPLRVLPPGRPAQAPAGVACVAEYLAERLGECRGVDIVRGERVGRIHSWLTTGAFELTDEERWKRLSSYVAIDAMVSVAPASNAAVEVRIFRSGGVTALKETVSDSGGAGMPAAVGALAERVGRELGLNDSDVRTLGAMRIDDPAWFRLYYFTRSGWASSPGNPYNGALASIEGLRVEPPHWALDAATVRIAASYMHWALRGRDADKLLTARRLARAPLLRLMGTEHEAEAYPLLRLDRRAATEPMMADFESTLLAIAGPLGRGKAMTGAADAGELDELLNANPADHEAPGELSEAPAHPGGAASDYTPAQRLGALRLLGVMASPKALPLLRQTASLADAALRQVTAEALASFAGEEGIPELTRLAGDADARVAFAAARALAQRQRTPADLRSRALAMLGAGEPYRTQAAEALASDPTLDDEALAARLAGDEAPSVRAALRRARAGRASGTAARLATAMSDPDADAVIAAIRGLPAGELAAGGDSYQRLVRLANDPDASVAQAARDALAPLRPAGGRDRVQFDLAVAAPYVRHRTVAQLRESREAWARAELTAACTNGEAHTRAEALKAIAALDPAAARGLLLEALADAHLFVRFHAAALLAPLADAGQAPAIRDAMPRQKDRATALYLADALARVAGGPPPAPQPPANSVTGGVTVAWLYGPTGQNPDSPYRMEFKPSHGNHIRDDAIPDTAKAAHAKGRAYFCNVGPLGESGVGVVDGSAQDGYWLYLDDQLDTAALPYIDGVDFGHGPLSPDALWPAGWSYFCEETGIDAARVAGDRKNLNAYEAQAWTAWALRRCVEGRNRVYDYFTLKFGRLHPGMAVCASVGGEADSAVLDLRFDAGFARGDPKADSRVQTYAVVRRAKTLWPGRPVFWHGEGLDVPNMTTMKFDFKMPSEPLVGRHYRAYTDALTAWMAGADPGWDCSWVLRAHGWKGDPDYTGAAVTPEDCEGEAARLRAAIDFAFAGVEPVIRDREAQSKAAAVQPGLATAADDAQPDALLDSVVRADDASVMTKRIAAEKDRMFLGFRLYAKHLLDIARLFASLPRNVPRPEALVIQSAAADAGSQGSELLNSYDCLFDINAVARLNLGRYRLIAVDDPPALTDATIACITRWLKETPGLLYVHRDLTADNARQAGTPEQFGGRLTLDWPWEGDVRVTAAPGGGAARTYEVIGPRARSLAKAAGSPSLVLWQHPDFKGAVVFDAVEGGGEPHRQDLRRVFADLGVASATGIDGGGLGRHEADRSERWTAETTAGSTEGRTVTGVDLLTGMIDPVVGPGKSAAFVAKDLRGKYAAAGNGVSVLCDQPIGRVEKSDAGLAIECAGLIQAASETGRLDVERAGGGSLPAIDGARAKRWVFLESSEGIASLPAPDGLPNRPASVIYIRSGTPVVIRAR